MNITVNKSELLKILSVASKALPKSDVLPIINNLYFDVTGSQLVAKATNLEVEVVSKMEFDTAGNASLLLPPNIVAIVESLPSFEVELSFDREGNMLNIKSGSAKFVLNTKKTEDYPVINEKTANGKSMSFTKKELKKIIDQALTCVSTDESRPAFMSVAFLFGETDTKVVSSDTYRLSYRIEDVAYGADKMMLVPGRSMKELVRLLGTGDEPVEVFTDDASVVFRTDEFYFSARTVNEKFPDISSVIPKRHKTQVTLAAKELEEMIGRVAIVAESKKHAIQLKFTDGTLELNAESEIGESREILVPEHCEGEDVELYVNALFLLDAVKSASGKSVRVCMNGTTGPIVIYNEETDDWLCLVLPVKK